MKKSSALLAGLCLMFGLAACQKPAEETAPVAPPAETMAPAPAPEAPAPEAAPEGAPQAEAPAAPAPEAPAGH